MRRYLASFAFVLTVSAAPALAATAATEDAHARATTAAPRLREPEPGLHDEAAMVLIGTALLVLAAAVRRAA